MLTVAQAAILSFASALFGVPVVVGFLFVQKLSDKRRDHYGDVK